MDAEARAMLVRLHASHNAYAADLADELRFFTYEELQAAATSLNDGGTSTEAPPGWALGRMRDRLAAWSLHREIRRRIETDLLEDDDK